MSSVISNPQLFYYPFQSPKGIGRNIVVASVYDPGRDRSYIGLWHLPDLDGMNSHEGIMMNGEMLLGDNLEAIMIYIDWDDEESWERVAAQIRNLQPDDPIFHLHRLVPVPEMDRYPRQDEPDISF